MPHQRRVDDGDYARLLAVRTRLRQFERWSAQQAASHGLTARQHQLLLSVRGHDDPAGPTIGQVAEYLLIRHHSAVELADRTERLGLITRSRDSEDRRVVRLQLAPAGAAVLESLTSVTLEELEGLLPLFESLIKRLADR